MWEIPTTAPGAHVAPVYLPPASPPRRRRAYMSRAPAPRTPYPLAMCLSGEEGLRRVLFSPSRLAFFPRAMSPYDSLPQRASPPRPRAAGPPGAAAVADTCRYLRAWLAAVAATHRLGTQAGSRADRGAGGKGVKFFWCLFTKSTGLQCPLLAACMAASRLVVTTVWLLCRTHPYHRQSLSWALFPTRFSRLKAAAERGRVSGRRRKRPQRMARYHKHTIPSPPLPPPLPPTPNPQPL